MTFDFSWHFISAISSSTHSNRSQIISVPDRSPCRLWCWLLLCLFRRQVFCYWTISRWFFDFPLIGKTVWGMPRSMASIVTKINRIDMSRRSPSYELRLAKYARRGWEVYHPSLQRENVNPEVILPLFRMRTYISSNSTSYTSEVSQPYPSAWLAY